MLYDGRFLHLGGWEAFSAKQNIAPEERILLLKDKERFLAFRPFTMKRPDVANALSDEALENSGFYCVIDMNGLSDPHELTLYSAYSDGERLVADETAKEACM